MRSCLRAGGGAGPGAGPPASAGATSGLISAMASTDLRIAAPIVVPRPVVSVSIAWSSAARSVVGATATCAKPANSTRPMRVSPSCACTKSRTAVWAAVSRLGSTSVAHIDPETSSARIMAASETGTSTLSRGRAAASPSAARAASSSATGTCRFHAARRGAAARISATLEYRTARRRLRRSCHTYAPASSGTASSARSARGQVRHRYSARPNQSSESPTPASTSSRGRGREQAGDLDVLGLDLPLQVDGVGNLGQRRPSAAATYGRRCARRSCAASARPGRSRAGSRRPRSRCPAARRARSGRRAPPRWTRGRRPRPGPARSVFSPSESRMTAAEPW